MCDIHRVKAENLEMAVHSGTHMDAPLHFCRDKWSIDEIPIEHFVNRPLVVIDVVKKVNKNSDYEISEEDIISWEQENGQIPEGAVIFFRTGFHKYYGNRLKYIGNVTPGHVSLHFPGLSPDGAEWIVQNRLVVGVGIDALSIDPGQEEGFMSHQMLLDRNMYIIENLNSNIEKLPAAGAKVSIFPLKLEGASGSPCRVIVDVNSSHHILPSSSLLLIISLVFIMFAVIDYSFC